MSYFRERKPVKIASWDVVSQDTGATITYAQAPGEVVSLASSLYLDPRVSGVLFVGIDEDGYQVNSWTLEEVLNGTFEQELA